MCLPLFFIVFQVLTLKCVSSYPYNDYVIAYIPVEELAYLSPESIEAVPLPSYGNGLFYSPWYHQSRMTQATRYPFRQTRGPVSFGGQVRAKGAVTITGTFGNQGYGTFTSYSAPPSPLAITSQPAWPLLTNLLTVPSLPTSTSLPAITRLPAVALPSATGNQPCIDTMPSTVSVPTIPMPSIVVTTTVPNDNIDFNGNLISPVKFSGMVPASGRVRIATHFGC